MGDGATQKPAKGVRWQTKTIPKPKSSKRQAIDDELARTRRQQSELKADFYKRTALKWQVSP